jgi:hypothetical protein
MSTGGFLDAKNQANVAAYYWRVHMQGGSRHYRARDLQDMRNSEQLEWWEEIAALVAILSPYAADLRLHKTVKQSENVCMFHRRQAS